jgi:hypothetical protein
MKLFHVNYDTINSQVVIACSPLFEAVHLESAGSPPGSLGRIYEYTGWVLYLEVRPINASHSPTVHHPINTWKSLLLHLVP